MLKYLLPAALVTALLPTAAMAQETTTVHVAYRDLDLRSPAGVRLLDRRVAYAVAKVCPEDPDLGLSYKLMVTRCRVATQASVAAQRAAVLAKAGRGDVALAARGGR